MNFDYKSSSQILFDRSEQAESSNFHFSSRIEKASVMNDPNDRAQTCPICFCEIDNILILECCHRVVHRDCFIQSLEAYDFKRLICPLCQKPLSYSQISILTPKQTEIVIQLKSERACNEFFRTKTELINRYKLLTRIISRHRYSHALHRKAQGIILFPRETIPESSMRSRRLRSSSSRY